MKFSYSIRLYEHISEEGNHTIEMMTGVIEADSKQAAPRLVWPLVDARVDHLRRATGKMVAHGPLLTEYVDCHLSAEEITPGEYQRHALRTLYPDYDLDKRLGLCGMGLSGEIGEVVDLIKKYLYHRNGKPLDIDKLKDELGDVLWYYFILLDTLGLTFEEVMMANAMKLLERHPNGFNPHYASDSHASE